MTLPSQSPKVSVIVPNYNHAPYLQARLDSILAQRFQDFELIVLDDASTDDSLNVIRDRLSGYPHRLIVNQVNSGAPCLQWLKGVSISRGELIWIAESDDTCSDDFLERCVERFSDDTVIVYTRTQAIDEHGDAASTDHFWPDEIDPCRWRRDYDSLAGDELGRYLTQRNTLPNASSVLFRCPDPAHFQEAIRFRYTGDWVFWATLLARTPKSLIRYIALPLTLHRSHQATTRFFAGDSAAEIHRLREYSTSLLYVGRLSSLSFWPFICTGLKGGWDWMYVSYLNRRSSMRGLPKYLPPFQKEAQLVFFVRLFLDPCLGRAYLSLSSYRRGPRILRNLRLWLRTNIARLKHQVKSRWSSTL